MDDVRGANGVSSPSHLHRFIIFDVKNANIFLEMPPFICQVTDFCIACFVTSSLINEKGHWCLLYECNGVCRINATLLGANSV